MVDPKKVAVIKARIDVLRKVDEEAAKAVESHVHLAARGIFQRGRRRTVLVANEAERRLAEEYRKLNYSELHSRLTVQVATPERVALGFLPAVVVC